MSDTPEDLDPFGADPDGSNMLLTLAASYTYYVPNTRGERFALNFGLQWWRGYHGENRYMFTITPGFLTLGRHR